VTDRKPNLKIPLILSLKTGGRSLRALACLISFTACTHTDVATAPQAPCKNIDWFEAGRSEGTLGLPISRLDQHQKRCDQTPDKVNVEQYTVGRDAGLVEYCSPTVGMEAGRNDLTYKHVCPENLEKGFLTNYELGKKIRGLERDNVDLEERIRNLNRLTLQNQKNDSLLIQIKQLRSLHSKNESDITDIEAQAPQTGI
jgi:hypothetical protein